MIKQMTLKEAADLLSAGLTTSSDGEALIHSVPIHSVTTDTRALKPGELFVALTGKNFDGHEFLSDAANQEAVAAVVEKHRQLEIQKQFENIVMPLLAVDDTTQALGKFGAWNRNLFQGPLIAITGSCGKTTVKALLSSILSHCGPTHATKGNFNNHIGVPLTLLGLDKTHQFAVVEMGASGIGEINYLSTMATPDIALVNNVMPAHVEGFGSIDAIASEKGEIFSGLKSSGTAVINLDCPYSPRHSEKIDPKVKKLSFSLVDKRADFYATDIKSLKAGYTHWQLHTPIGCTEIVLKTLGQQNIANALAASVCAYAAGANLESIQRGLADFRAVDGRLSIREGIHGGPIIDDTYNASPGAVRAAIDSLSSYELEKVLVLGDMAELGEKSRHYHFQMGVYAKKSGISRLYTLGPDSESATRAFGEGARHFLTHNDLIACLKQVAVNEMVILVKGSRSAKMELVVEAMLAKRELTNGEMKNRALKSGEQL